MTWFDAGAIVLTVAAVVDGATSGLAWAALEMSVLLVSALAARAFAAHAEPYVAKVAAVPAATLPSAAHVVVFGLCASLLFAALVLAHPVAKKWRFRHDKWAGGGAGFVNGLMASVLVFGMVVTVAGAEAETALRETRMLPVVASLASGPVSGLFPARLAERAAELDRE